MRYPIAIEPRTDRSDYGVVIPDLPGAFSAGETLEEAIVGAEEAGLRVDRRGNRRWRTHPRALAARSYPREIRVRRLDLSLVTIDPAALDDAVERVNITLPRRILRRLDEEARAAGETRSGYIAKLALAR